jgi:large subunit ribosomal protein L26e
MKYSFKTSSKRRTNRKKFYKADSNQKRIFMSSKLEKNLREIHKLKTIPLRKGDEVKILRGDEKGKIGKIVQLSRKGIFIYINTITYKKMKGDENYLPIHPSNVEILNLILTPERKEYLSRIALIAKKFR